MSNKGMKWSAQQTAVDRTHRWTDAQKISAVAMWMEMGNMSRVSETIGIPVGTLHAWKLEPWWYDVEQRILKEQDAEMTTNFSKIVRKAQQKVLDRIENGDFIITKSGKKMRKEMSGRDLNSILNSGVISRNLLLDRPTSRTEKIDPKERLAKLHAEFMKFSSAKEVKQEPNEGT